MATETVEIKGKKIAIKRFGKELIPGFLELFHISFGKSVSEAQIRKKYDTRHLGGSYFGFMAFHNERPVAYYGVLPVPFILNGKKLTAVQSADTMTHPDYRRHGLFPLLAKKTYQLAKDRGATFVFGWPNENSYPAFKNKLGWMDLGRMQRFTFRIKTVPLAKIAHRFKLCRPIYTLWIKTILRRSGTRSVISSSSDNMIPRTDEYVRYKMNLDALVIETAYGNLLVGSDYRLKIGELNSNQIENFPKLMAKLKTVGLFLGMTEIQFITSPNSPYSRVLNKMGFCSEDDLPLMYWPFSDDVKIEELNLTGLDYDGF